MFKKLYLNNPNLFVIKKYQSNEVIFEEDTLCSKIGLVLKGNVHISTYTFTEKEYNIAIVSEGDTFGEIIMFSEKPYYLGNVFAFLDTTIAFISKENLLEVLKEKSYLESFLCILSNKTMRIQNRVKTLSQTSIKEKILFYIYTKYHYSKQSKIYLKSKEDLAKYLNIPRPSLSRELINLKKENIIDYDRHYIYLKSPKVN